MAMIVNIMCGLQFDKLIERI